MLGLHVPEGGVRATGVSVFSLFFFFLDLAKVCLGLAGRANRARPQSGNAR